MMHRLHTSFLVGFLLVIPHTKIDAQSTPIRRDHDGIELLRNADTKLTNGSRLKDGTLDGQFSAVFELMGSKTGSSGNIEAKFLGENYSSVYFEPQMFMALPATE